MASTKKQPANPGAKTAIAKRAADAFSAVKTTTSDRLPMTAGSHNPSADEPQMPGRFLVGASTPNTRLRNFNRWRERFNPLRGLNVQRAVTMLEQWQRGEFADPCWAYFFIECTDGDLFALCERRESALLELDWHVSPVNVKWRKDDFSLAKFDQKLADEQIACLGETYEGLDNLYEAIQHMSTSSFRGFAHLEKYRQPDGSLYHLEPVDQWNMVRDLLRGPWKYNPDAITTRYEALPAENAIDPADFVIRESHRHINRIALIKFIRANLSEKDWDAFIEITGIPSGVVIGPQNVPADKEAEFATAAQNIAEGGSGYLPNGSTYVPNPPARGAIPFRPRLDYLTEKLILAGTGGLLTMLVQSGSGTLAGNAHQETFEKIARAEARKISELFQKSIDKEILARQFPGKPALACFEVAANDELDPDKIVEHALKLRQAGYKMDLAQLTEKTGYILTEGPIEKIDVRSQEDDPSKLAKIEDDADTVKNRRRVRNRDGKAAATRGPDPATMGKLLARSRQLFGASLADDLAPLREALSKVLEGEGADFNERLQALYNELPKLGGEIIAANGSPDALEKILAASFANGLQPESNGPEKPVLNSNSNHDERGRFAAADTGGGFGGHSLSRKGQSRELTREEQRQSIQAALDASKAGKQASFSLGRVPASLAERIKDSTKDDPRDWEGKEMRIDSDFINHAQNYHPNLTDKDFHAIPEHMSGADKIVASTTNQKLPAVEFHKTTDGQRSLLVSASLNKSGQIAMTTLKKFKPESRA